MFRTLIVCVTCLLVVSIAPVMLHGQSTSPEAPGTPTAAALGASTASPWSVGLDAGIAAHVSSGSLVTTCNCSYPSATSLAPAAALSLSYRFSLTMGLALRVGYAGHSGEHLLTDQREWYDENAAKVMLTHERRALVTMSLLESALLFEWWPARDGLALHAGPVITSLLSTHINETERIVTPGYVYPDTKTNLVQIADADLADVRSINTLLLGLQVGGVWMIALTPTLAAGPAVSYTLPLTSILADGTSWKQHALRGAVRLRLSL